MKRAEERGRRPAPTGNLGGYQVFNVIREIVGLKEEGEGGGGASLRHREMDRPQRLDM